MTLKSLIYKMFALGMTMVMPKVPILIAAYLLSKNDYFFFNKYYYTASILILWGTFGFEYAFSFVKAKYSIVVSSVFANIVFISLLLFWGLGTDLNGSDLLIIALYSFFLSAAGIFSYRILFLGRIRVFFLVNLFNALILLCIVMFGVFFKERGIILGFLIGSALFFLVTFFYHHRVETEKFVNNTLPNLYMLGFSSFVINSIVPLMLALDKFIVNNKFNTVTANTYTFAWTITAPLFYIGNVVEKIIYSASGKEINLSKSFLLNTLLILAYSIAILFIINFYPSLLPGTINSAVLKEICLWMLFVYSVYALFHFPINGYLFKTQKESIQKSLAFKFIIIAILFSFIYYLLRSLITTDYRVLLIYNFSFLITLLIIKANEIWGFKTILLYIIDKLKGSKENVRK